MIVANRIEAGLEIVEARFAEAYEFGSRSIERLRIHRLGSTVGLLLPGDFGVDESFTPWGSIEVSRDAVRLEAHIPDKVDPEKNLEEYLELEVKCNKRSGKPNHYNGSRELRGHGFSGVGYVKFEADDHQIYEGHEILGSLSRAAKAARKTR